MSMRFESGELNITEVQSSDRIKRKDTATRAVDKTLQLNSKLDWRSSNAEDPIENEHPSTTRKRRDEQRLIMFKANTKEILKNYPAAEKILAATANIGFPEPVICAMIIANPKISTFDPERVSSNLSQLLNLQFRVSEIKSMIRRYPDLLQYEGYDIFDTVEAWRKASLSERFLCELFTMHPLFFSIPNEEAVRRLNRINYFMMKKINRVKSLLERNPSIMDGDWDRVEENFNYFYKTMRITEKDISRSKGLSLPLAFIKLRHTFLERCGEYIRPKMKETAGFNARKNPYLSEIVDTSDEVFALNVAKVSVDEYLVFKELMKNEDSQPPKTLTEDNDYSRELVKKRVLHYE